MRVGSKAELIEFTLNERQKLEAKVAGLTPAELSFPGRHPATPGRLGAALDSLV